MFPKGSSGNFGY